MNERTAAPSDKATATPAPGNVLQRACACGTHTGNGGECAECRQKREGTLQRSAVTPAAVNDVPPIVHEVLRSPGQPLDAGTRAFMEPRFGHEFSGVRVHTDSRAADSARAVNALAYTVGRNVVFGAGQHAPGTSAGTRLIAHELTHVVQQGLGQTTGVQPQLAVGDVDDVYEREADRVATNSIDQTTKLLRIDHNLPIRIQRVPAPPTYNGAIGTFDRSKVQIDFIPDIDVSKPFPLLQVKVNFNEPQVKHLTWMLYKPDDTYILGTGFSTSPGNPTSTTEPYELEVGNLVSGVQGRYLLRCTGLNAKHEPVVYADRTFFVWLSTPLSQQNLTDLNAIKQSPTTKSFGEVGAAYGRSMLLEHQAAVAATGTGIYEGNQCSTTTPKVSRTDCTDYVLEVLKKAFDAQGRSADWNQVFSEAKTTSGKKFKGTELLKALVNKAGWKAVFWSPSPRNPDDNASEHPAMYKRVRDDSEYRSSNEPKGTGIKVEKTKSVIDYRPTNATTAENMINLDKLRLIPFAVIAAKGGKHMVLLINAQVYEVHWDKPATDPKVLEATPLEKWGWNSGVVVMPSEDFKKVFNP